MAEEIASSARVTLADIGARVRGLEGDYQDVRRAVIDLDAKLDTTITSLGNKFESALSNLTNRIEQRSQTPWHTIWAALGVIATLMIAIGGALYWPINRDTSRLDIAVAAILDRGVFQREYNNDQSRTNALLDRLRVESSTNIHQQRYNVDQDRLNKELTEIKTSLEFLRNRSYDVHGRIAHGETSIADVDRRMDAISRRLAEFIRDMGKHQ